MARNLTIASRLREVLLDGHWIAKTNFREILNVNWEQATQKVDQFKYYCSFGLSYKLLFGRTIERF